MSPTNLASTLFVTLAVGLAVACAGTSHGPSAAAPRAEEGVPMVTQPSTSDTVSFAFVFRTGSSDDPAGKEGLTALTAALMAEGGTAALSYAELVGALFPMAASIHAEVDRDVTAFTGRVHVDHLETYYGLLRDVLLRPRMGEADFERLTARAQASLTKGLRTSDDEELGKAVLHAFLFAGHPYAHPEIGTESGLAALTLEAAQAHRARVFCRERLSVGLAGGFPPELAERIRKDMAALPSCTAAPAPLPSAPDVPRNEVWLVEKPEAMGTGISFGFPIELNRDHPDYPALFLVASWLGQHRNSVSHLFKKIREQRGLNYGDYAYIEYWPNGGRTTLPPVHAVRRQQFFSVWIRPVPHETRHFALRTAVRELDRLVEQGLTQEQFEDIRRFISRYVAFYVMSERRRLGYAMDDAFLGLDESSLEQLRRAWAELTLDEVNAAIRRHLRADRLRIVAVTRDAESFAADLAADAASPITYRTPKPDSVLEEDKEIERFPIPVRREDIRITPYDELFR